MIFKRKKKQQKQWQIKAIPSVDIGKEENLSKVMGISTGTIIMEISVEFAQKARFNITYNLSLLLLRVWLNNIFY